MSHSKSSSSRRSKGSSSSKHSRSHGASSRSASSPDISFLFVVNELLVDDAYLEDDMWCNDLPPIRPEGYVSEEESVVFRFYNGQITEARDYTWVRPDGMGTEGQIVPKDESEIDLVPSPYKCCTIFSCNQHTPIIAVNDDASLGNSGYRPLAHDHNDVWSMLGFLSDENYPGVSRAVIEPGRGVNYVHGVNPSWIPSLVPGTFRAHSSRIPASQGLSGDLCMIIGLMAFALPRDHHGPRTNEIFLGGAHQPMWHRYRWRGPSSPAGYPKHDQRPRGFLVHISLDDVRNENSTPESLQYLEWMDILVRES